MIGKRDNKMKPIPCKVTASPVTTNGSNDQKSTAMLVTPDGGTPSDIVSADTPSESTTGKGVIVTIESRASKKDGKEIVVNLMKPVVLVGTFDKMNETSKSESESAQKEDKTVSKKVVFLDHTVDSSKKTLTKEVLVIKAPLLVRGDPSVPKALREGIINKIVKDPQGYVDTNGFKAFDMMLELHQLARYDQRYIFKVIQNTSEAKFKSSLPVAHKKKAVLEKYYECYMWRGYCVEVTNELVKYALDGSVSIAVAILLFPDSKVSAMAEHEELESNKLQLIMGLKAACDDSYENMNVVKLMDSVVPFGATYDAEHRVCFCTVLIFFLQRLKASKFQSFKKEA